MKSPGFTARFDQAVVYAHHLHQKQVRKGSETPYIGHLLAVASLVIEDGGDEEQVIAALLHDAVEDQGGKETLEDIRQRFGEHVAEIVDYCSDAYGFPKPPWKARKEQYLSRLRGAPPYVLRVSLADKLHNARAILLDLRTQGTQVWSRFNGGRDGTLWYYRSLAAIFTEVSTSPMAGELVRVVGEIERLAAQDFPA